MKLINIVKRFFERIDFESKKLRNHAGSKIVANSGSNSRETLRLKALGSKKRAEF